VKGGMSNHNGGVRGMWGDRVGLVAGGDWLGVV
jgi:hypothetical protein